MYIKSFLAKGFAFLATKKMQRWIKNPIHTQHRLLTDLLEAAKNTQFGRDHRFHEIKNYKDFVDRVPKRDYEGLRPYIDRVVAGEAHILWKGKPLYFAKTSGTTSGIKYIPITKASMPYHIRAARDAILCYIAESGRASFTNGKMIFLQGSPILEKHNGIKIGRLSGIVAHYVPKYLQKNRLPSWETNCIEDWEKKVEAIVGETLSQDMTVIAGIPSWAIMYFEKIAAKSNKPVGEVFKNLELFIHGGVNYEPYKPKIEHVFGRPITTIELYPASEGFFAFQDSQKQEGLLLLLDSGIFYEFIPVGELQKPHPQRLPLERVRLDEDYALLISTNAGLWAYEIGDTVRFTSLNPYRIKVSGRIKHFISAFGEHVIAKEVEEAIAEAILDSEVRITEFTVAPQVSPPQGELPYHEWFIEFENEPHCLEDFSSKIDLALQKQNIYYKDLIQGKVLQPLKITKIGKNGFLEYMKSIGKLGGQNKIQRLSNDRAIANKILIRV